MLPNASCSRNIMDLPEDCLFVILSKLSPVGLIKFRMINKYCEQLFLKNIECKINKANNLGKLGLYKYICKDIYKDICKDICKDSEWITILKNSDLLELIKSSDLACIRSNDKYKIIKYFTAYSFPKSMLFFYLNNNIDFLHLSLYDGFLKNSEYPETDILRHYSEVYHRYMDSSEKEHFLIISPDKTIIKFLLIVCLRQTGEIKIVELLMNELKNYLLLHNKFYNYKFIVEIMECGIMIENTGLIYTIHISNDSDNFLDLLACKYKELFATQLDDKNELQIKHYYDLFINCGKRYNFLIKILKKLHGNLKLKN